jgi:hypothetical protein
VEAVLTRASWSLDYGYRERVDDVPRLFAICPASCRALHGAARRAREAGSTA